MLKCSRGWDTVGAGSDDSCLSQPAGAPLEPDDASLLIPKFEIWRDRSLELDVDAELAELDNCGTTPPGRVG